MGSGSPSTSSRGRDGRGTAERINGDKSLVLERHSCERVLVAALGGVGLLGEITDLLAWLRAQRAARACVAVVVPIKGGAASSTSDSSRRGRPSTSRASGSSDTTSSSASARSSSSSKATAQPPPSTRSHAAPVLDMAVRWRGILPGRPRLAEEPFGWTRST